MLPRLIARAGAAAHLTETEVTVGDEGSHRELLGQCESLTVEAFGHTAVGASR